MVDVHTASDDEIIDAYYELIGEVRPDSDCDPFMMYMTIIDEQLSINFYATPQRMWYVERAGVIRVFRPKLHVAIMAYYLHKEQIPWDAPKPKRERKKRKRSRKRRDSQPYAQAAGSIDS